MATKPLQTRKKDISKVGDDLGKLIGQNWSQWNTQRQGKINEWKELRNYVFATDTTTTSNSTLPWKNKTTIPKLCQIRDNLHSNYISALFPNDEWVKWEGYSLNDATKVKKEAIEAYIRNKCRMNGFRSITSQLVYDYIDYGNVFGTVDYEIRYRPGRRSNEMVVAYQGPVLKRISPLDIVFDPTAATFEKAPKIVRSLVTIGELYEMADSEPDNAYLAKALKTREDICARPAAYGFEEDSRIEAYQVDGFGNYMEYLESGYVEMLTFYGDIFDIGSRKLNKGRRIVVIDRMHVIENEPIPQWLGDSPIYHAGWRTRPDNLWAMGPLDNLVGMQYRIDHLENLKSDAMDLAVLPPLVIAGEVEEFTYAPGAEIHIDENGTVTELARNAQWVIQAENAIQVTEQRMEMYAGAPREAMGIRTAGEKTAFEVQQLQNAAGRIFQEKITNFEVEFVEKILNAMLETGVRNMDGKDIVSVMDNDIGAQIFQTITRADIVANGVLRPIGARHFAAQAQLMQNLNGIFNSPLGQSLAPHTSTKRLAALVEDTLGLSRYELFRPNAGIAEQQETQTAMNAAQEEIMAQQQTEPLP